MDNEALLAIKNGNLPELKKSLNQGININAQDNKHRTLLHHAASTREYEITKYLLQKGADILLTTKKYNTVLHIAVTKSDEIMTMIIIKYYTRDKIQKLLNTQTKSNGMTALHFVAKNDSYLHAFPILQAGANFEVANHANEKPSDIAKGDELSALFQLINSSFLKATKGDSSLNDDLESCEPAVLFTVLNSRNNSDHTLMQILILNDHYELARDVLWLREKPILQREPEGLYSPEKKSEVDELAEKAKECRDIWATLSLNVSKHVLERVCHRVLEKAKEVLLAYKKFEGIDQPLTINVCMKTLEEVFEILEGDQKPKHYKNLPSLVHLVANVINAVEYFKNRINVIQLFNAVKDNELNKVQQLVNGGLDVNPVDDTCRSPICYAAEKGYKRMVKLLLKYEAKVKYELTMSPVYLAVEKKHVKVVKILLQNVKDEDLSEVVDFQGEFDRTALHVAAMKGRLDIVKMLLRYGASYSVLDVENHTPLDLSTSEEASEFLKLVDQCFREAKEANVELVYRLKAMEIEDFMAVSGTRNREGERLAIVAAKANAKSIAGVILRMMKEAKKDKK